MSFSIVVSSVTSSAQSRNLNSRQYQFSLAGEVVSGHFRVSSAPGIFGAVGAGLFSSCGAQASPCDDFSCDPAQALEAPA